MMIRPVTCSSYTRRMITLCRIWRNTMKGLFVIEGDFDERDFYCLKARRIVYIQFSPSIIHHPLSIIRHPLSIIHHPSSHHLVIHHLLSIIHCPLSRLHSVYIIRQSPSTIYQHVRAGVKSSVVRGDRGRFRDK